MAVPPAAGPAGRGQKRDREELRASCRPFADLPFLSEKYAILEESSPTAQVGGGTYGTILVARSDTGVEVAVKRLNLAPVDDTAKRLDSERYARREIRSLRAVSGHVNVIELLDYRRDALERVYLVFPLVAHDLYGIIKRHGTTLAPGQVKGYVKQIFEALQWCHSKDVMHRDVKPDNILVTADNVIKLADFGMSCAQMKQYERFTNPVQTLWYRAPELLMGISKYGPEVDVWAAGCVMAFCLFAAPMFPGDGEDKQLPLIFETCGTPRDIDTTWPEAMRDAAYKSFKYSKPCVLAMKLTGTHNASARKSLFTPGAVAVLETMLRLNPSARAGWEAILGMPYFVSEHPTPYASETMRTFRGNLRAAKIHAK